MLSRNKNRIESLTVYNEVAYQSLSTEICRICLKEGEIPIFGQDDKSEDVVEFGGIEIAADDNLPQHLCYSCNSLLESAIVFRTTAKKSDEILKNTEYLDLSILSEDQNYVSDNISETDNEPFIKREYLENNYSSESESELTLKYEVESDNEQLMNIKSEPSIEIGTDIEISVPKKEIEMQLLNLKDEDENIDVDNELVMIIVSDKEKPNKSSFSCLKCNITFKNHAELEQHESINHPETPMWCKKCDICHESVHKNKFKLHIKQHRQMYKEKHNKKYGKVECEVCSKKVNKTYYKYHIKMHGTAEEQADRFVECTICNKTFTALYYSEHLKRVHNKTFRPKQTSQTPDENESKIQVIMQCPICDRNVNENIYKEHLAKHGGPTRRYICDKCGRAFKHPSAFKTHTLTHGSELKYQCQFCPYRGLHLGLLKVHVRTHTGDYNYKCSECPARFITKSNLSKHLIRHRGLCKFKCGTCNKGFYSKRDVDKHIRTVHLDLKNNVCDKCGKGFGHRDNLLGHQLKVHKREKMERRGRMPSYLKEEYKKS
ncbi:unnamed protein product [Arctia plantaginis]|uniref:Uncharacterized protein n=1 Tax=Arctia plantaginis TaxID=874455 RepID=A0A8S0Z4A1_ARCPL|nr:unnamed protein product [Arctia plantaginis]